MSRVNECRMGEWVEDGGCGRMKPGGWLCLIGEKGAWLSLWDTGMGVGGGEWMDLLVMGWQVCTPTAPEPSAKRPGVLQSMGSQSTSIFLPGKSHGQRNLEGYSPWGCNELDTT